MGVGGQCHTPAVLPPGMPQYPLYRRLGGPQGRCGRVLKISPPPGFDPQTIQPVASRYTNYAILAHNLTPSRMNHKHGQIKFAVFWGITRRRVVIVYRRFRTTYRSHLHGSKVYVGKKARNKERKK
jgi:hypothetical protein